MLNWLPAIIVFDNFAGRSDISLESINLTLESEYLEVLLVKQKLLPSCKSYGYYSNAGLS